ncbi:rCG31240 [Rattus norvegicus]|uniref:RCG31240 n=1 Tax=Rattus norvegicus TaxID=10116 RepID=A6IS46_RAT|nr:rCG31240 [Rattus norvegicus]
MALKVILHVSTGRGPGAPCVLAPSLDHNTGSIDSCIPSFPRCPQSHGLMVPSHRLLSHRIHPRRRPGLARRTYIAPAQESLKSRLEVMANLQALSYPV